MVLMINEVDFKPYLEPQGFQWRRQDREGDNGGMVLSGEELRDRLAIKHVLEVSLRAVPLRDANRLLRALEPEYVPVIYTDPSVGDVTGKIMKTTSVSAGYLTVRNGEEWYTGVSFQLTER